MDDPGTLIYIAFLVISLIGGLIRNWNKKQEEKPAQPKPAPSSRYDKETIGELSRKSQAKNREAAARIEELEAEAKAVLAAPKRIKRPRGPMLLEDETLTTSGVSKQFIEDTFEDFDPRKAIIYSEILNPPYL